MFLCNLLSWTKLYIAEGQCPYLTSSIGWPFTERGSSFFVIPCPFFGAFWRPLYTSCVFWCTLFGVLKMDGFFGLEHI